MSLNFALCGQVLRSLELPYLARSFTVFKQLKGKQQAQQQQQHLLVHPEVQRALQCRAPVVALESTIITHGMPHPENVETALEVERLVRNHGALPATIGILDGRIKVGLTEQELYELAKKPRKQLIKCSRRDLPYVVAMKQSGGTTVAATMLIAHSVGIKIFATGGIGGVHRDGHVTMDVSADLMELGRTPVVVVSSGIKSILDIPRTLEYLETQGVCVATFDSRGGIFPDFYTRDSGCRVPYNLTDAHNAAEVIQAWRKLNLESGMLIGVAVPAQYAADKSQIQVAIDQAQREAQAKNIEGKDVTPFLLSAIAKITDGSSLQANIALIKNNAAVAAQIAKALADRESFPRKKPTSSGIETGKAVVIGASILDLSFTVNDRSKDMRLDGATYTATAKQTAGGVGRNLAEGLLKLYGDVRLISAVGDDYIGRNLVQMMPSALQSYIIVDNQNSTSMCSVIFNRKGDCKLILGNMDVHKSISAEHIHRQLSEFQNTELIVMDSNLSIEAMTAVLAQAKQQQLPVFFEPTDVFIAGKPFQLPAELTKYIRLVTPNIQELITIVETIAGAPVSNKPTASGSTLEQLLNDTKELLKQINQRFNCIIVTLGEHGVLISLRADAANDVRQLMDISTVYQQTEAPKHVTRFYAAPKVQNIVNVSGAGDSFSAGFVAAILQNRPLEGCVAMGFLAAERALQSDSAVPSTYFHDADSFETRYRNTLDALQAKVI